MPKEKTVYPAKPRRSGVVKKVVKKEKAARQTACQIEVLDTEGKTVGKIDLSEKIFNAKINKNLLAQAVRVYLANQRQGTQSTKTRGEVRASTAKIYRQKGTGRARHGAISAPIFVGGGVAHGPKPRDFSLKMPKKMRRAALFGALTTQLNQKNILAVAGLEEVKPKTKETVKILKNLKLSPKGLLIVLPGKSENLERGARNIEGLNLIPAASLNPYLVLRSKKLVFLPDSFMVVEKTFLTSEKIAKVQHEENEN